MIPRHIRCKQCAYPEADVYEEDKRYKVNCNSCGYNTYLKIAASKDKK